jgi:imidazolonepropionase-like amidohydrolase
VSGDHDVTILDMRLERDLRAVLERSNLSPEEAAAVVQTAHERGIPVTADATSVRELERALGAGVDDVAHLSGDHVPDRVIRRMVDAGVHWIPTLEALHGQRGSNLLRFVEAGGHVAMGTDAGYLPGLEIGTPLDELVLVEEAGMTPMEIIVAATRNAARVCRLERHLGTLEAGKLADVLVVAGDPSLDLGALARVRLVIHGGVIIRQRRATPVAPPRRPETGMRVTGRPCAGHPGCEDEDRHVAGWAGLVSLAGRLSSPGPRGPRPVD